MARLLLFIRWVFSQKSCWNVPMYHIQHRNAAARSTPENTRWKGCANSLKRWYAD